MSLVSDRNRPHLCAALPLTCFPARHWPLTGTSRPGPAVWMLWSQSSYVAAGVVAFASLALVAAALAAAGSPSDLSASAPPRPSEVRVLVCPSSLAVPRQLIALNAP